MTASLPIPHLEGLTRERELVAEMLRRSRLLLLYGAAGCGKTTLLRSVCSQEGSDIAVLFDSWHRPLLPRLRDWMHATLCARLGRETVGPPPASCSITENVRAWRGRLGVRFLVVFDQFEHFLMQSPADEGVAAFAEEFIRAASAPVDGIHFLLSLREEDKFGLVRFQRSIPGLYDSWIRLPPQRDPHASVLQSPASVWAFAPRVPQASQAAFETAFAPRTPANVSGIPAKVREASMMEEALRSVAETALKLAPTPSPAPGSDTARGEQDQPTIAETRPKLSGIDIAALMQRAQGLLDLAVQRLIAFAALVRQWNAATFSGIRQRSKLLFDLGVQRLIASPALIRRLNEPINSGARQLIAVAAPAVRSWGETIKTGARRITDAAHPAWTRAVNSGPRRFVASAALLIVMLAAWLWLAIGSKEPSVTATEVALVSPAVSTDVPPSSDDELASGRSREALPAENAQRNGGGDRAASTTNLAGESAEAPLVFILFRDESQRRQAERLKRRLAQKGITVSGIRQIERGPQIADLRYFRQVEANEARRVQRALNELGVQTQIKRIGGYETTATPRQYELWLAPVASGS
jgi:hypothetical protein